MLRTASRFGNFGIVKELISSGTHPVSSDRVRCFAHVDYEILLCVVMKVSIQLATRAAHTKVSNNNKKAEI